MDTYEMSRAVGVFDVFFAPLNGIGMFDVSAFDKCVSDTLAAGHRFIGLDLSGLVTLNSGSFNCLFQTSARVASAGGEFALIVDNADMDELLTKFGIKGNMRVFGSEVELLNYSLVAGLDSAPIPAKIEEPAEERSTISQIVIEPQTPAEHAVANNEPAFDSAEDALAANLWVILLVGVLALGGVLLYMLL